MTLKIAYVYLSGRIERIPLLRQGNIPTEFFYGAAELEERGHKVDMFELVPGKRTSLFRFMAEKVIPPRWLPPKTFIGLFDSARELIPSLSGYDTVVATASGLAFALTFWSAWQKNFPPIAAIQCGIMNYPLNTVRVAASKWLFRKMYTQVFGQGEVSIMKNSFKIPDDRLEVNEFGVDTNYWCPDVHSQSKNFILSVGNDSLRDYHTLVKAVEQMTWPVKIVTRRNLPDCLPGNVEHIMSSWKNPEIDDSGLRDLYRGAACVVVPLRKGSVQPSGQSVALQAMACGKPVILTDTQGLWDRTRLRHLENIVFVPPGDPGALAQAINIVMADEQLREQIGRRSREYSLAFGTIESFADKMENLCLRLHKRET